MEKPLSRHYSDLEKQELIDQWNQSGKSKISFCKEQGLNYHSFNDWVRRRNRRKKSGKSSSVPLSIAATAGSNFATLTLKSGTRVILHQPVEAVYLLALLKS